jgi:HPt (histidine-containing phosphotransfer) domain-containing protein
VSEPERPASAPAPLTVVSSHFDAPAASSAAPPSPPFKLSRPATAAGAAPVELEVPVIPDGPALDLEQLESACMGLQPLRASLLQTFLHDVPIRVERLARAFEAEDTRRVEFEAHGLRGMCATVGANGCVTLFGEIEDRARDDQAAAARALLQPARDEVERTEQFIRRFETILQRDAA